MTQDDLAALARRIDQVESRAVIADLIHAYARFIRQDEPERVAELFAPDGSFEIRDGHPDRPEHVVRGHFATPEELRAYLAPTKGKPHPIPLIHNIIVELDGDRATANSVMEAQVFGTDHRVFGEYSDSFSRIGGRWCFAARIFTMFGTVPVL